MKEPETGGSLECGDRSPRFPTWVHWLVFKVAGQGELRVMTDGAGFRPSA
jgi:hypothetical protein